MFKDTRYMREVRASIVAPDGTALGNLRHFVNVFAEANPDEMILMSSSNIYPPSDPGVVTLESGVTRTGITYGDLRTILEMLEPSELEEDSDGAPYPAAAQGSHPAAIALRSILDRHGPGILDD